MKEVVRNGLRRKKVQLQWRTREKGSVHNPEKGREEGRRSV
jgi:hypothetical protein